MRAKDAVRLRTVRSLRAALMEAEIAVRTGGAAVLTEEQEMAVVQKQAKQRRDAIEQYRGAGREDLAAVEERIAITRRVYNDTVETLNTKVQVFPSVLVARGFGFTAREFFAAGASAQVVPSVEIGSGSGPV